MLAFLGFSGVFLVGSEEFFEAISNAGFFGLAFLRWLFWAGGGGEWF